VNRIFRLLDFCWNSVAFETVDEGFDFLLESFGVTVVNESGREPSKDPWVPS